MTQLKEQIISIANTTYAGSYIFSGFKTNQALMDGNGKYLPVDLSKNESIEFNIGISDRMAVNIVPQKLFGVINGLVTADSPVDANAIINSSAPLPSTPNNIPQMIQVFDDLIKLGLEGDSDSRYKKRVKKIRYSI